MENHLEVLVSVYRPALSDPHRTRSARRAYPAVLTYQNSPGLSTEYWSPVAGKLQHPSPIFTDTAESPAFRLTPQTLSTESGQPKQVSRPMSSETPPNTLNFHIIASFGVPQTRKQSAVLLRPFKQWIQYDAATRLLRMRMAYTALANMYNPELAERFKDEILVGGPPSAVASWRSPFRSSSSLSKLGRFRRCRRLRRLDWVITCVVARLERTVYGGRWSWFMS